MGSEIALFGAILLRSEAAASSRIENLTASAKAVALAEFGDTSRRNATEIVANTTAMTAALALADRLDAPAILAMHAALLEHHDPKIAGTWRSAQVWVGALQEITGGRRNRRYAATQVLAALDAFAERAGRRMASRCCRLATC